ncbi:MAG: substrate-binding domain-containing protein [Oscillatoria sp. PMC 1051.18]|nr:substrate-binding domain-containing protein [Oscillatoria sp. PMC 1050.18]MEC5029721.1 substrate-binding domain-containing protein [Oscillatoria sp. PMC 1051.18]
MKIKRQMSFLLAGILLLGVNGCAGSKEDAEVPTPSTSGSASPTDVEIQEDVIVDGSTVVFPASDAISKKFMTDNPELRVTVGLSNSEVSFKRFCLGDTDMAGASRPISKAEMDICEANNVQFVEVPYLFEVVTLVVHPNNDWASCLTLEQVKQIWQPVPEEGEAATLVATPPSPEGETETPEKIEKIENWNQINQEYPARKIVLYGPDNDSDTYEYFADTVIEQNADTRVDYNLSEQQTEVIENVKANPNSLGFVNLGNYQAYYQEEETTDQEKLEQKENPIKLVPIDNGSEQCVEPTPEMVYNGNYKPLSRPLFLYVNKGSLETRDGVQELTEYLFDSDNDSVYLEAGYLPLSGSILNLAKKRLDNLTTGSIFEGESVAADKLLEMLNEAE